MKLPIARKRETYPGVARREPTFTPGVRQSSATIEGDTKRKTSTEMEDLRGSTMHQCSKVLPVCGSMAYFRPGGSSQVYSDTEEWLGSILHECLYERFTLMGLLLVGYSLVAPPQPCGGSQ